MGSLLDTFRRRVDNLHFNASWREERAGRPVLVKRRRIGSGLVFAFANAFFRAARNPVEAITDRRTWRQWEVDCFNLLHAPEFAAGEDPAGTVWIHALPGQSLSDFLDARTLTPAMLGAAARELRRAHTFDSPHYGSAFSHGDPHSGNFLFDPATNRARLIDFEVRHLRSWAAPDRHADDVLILLQDVCGRCPAERWSEFARAIIDGYEAPEVTARIRARLTIPRGIPRLWWSVRTTWLSTPELQSRLDQLTPLLPT